MLKFIVNIFRKLLQNRVLYDIYIFEIKKTLNNRTLVGNRLITNLLKTFYNRL